MAVALSTPAPLRLGHAVSGKQQSSRSLQPRCGASGRKPSSNRASPTSSSRHGSTELPSEQGFLLDEATNRHGAVVYGQNFIMHRHAPGGPGLVLSPGAKMQPYRGSGGNLSLALALMQTSNVIFMQQQTGLVPFGSRGMSLSDGALVIDTYADEISDGDCSPPSTAAASCLAMVVYEDPSTAEVSLHERDEEGQQVVENTSNNPRRTKKVQFTCKLCHTTTISPVNPHAWEEGSVFARCGGCNVVHKIRDNLELFHEVTGPVFGAQLPRVRIPKGLPQNPGAGLDQPIGGFRLLDDDLAL